MGASVIVVRGQEPEDIAGLTELLNQPRAIWGTLQLPHTSVAARRARSEGPSPGRPATRLVALIDGKVVGSLGLDRFEGRRAHVGAFGMAVHDDFAGLGVGTALMQAMIDQADRWLGLIRLELTVWADNVRAIATGPTSIPWPWPACGSRSMARLSPIMIRRRAPAFRCGGRKRRTSQRPARRAGSVLPGAP